MRRSIAVVIALSVASSSACSSSAEGSPADAGDETAPDTAIATESGADADASSPAADADALVDVDAREVDPNACFPFGASGECMTTEACAAIPDHSSFSGYCPGAADVQCCIDTPDVADNPPVPAGWKLMQQSEVTSDMTSWAVAILHDPTTYPMYSTTTKLFGSLDVMARVEWHPPDFLNSAVHRGVTLYEPA